MTWSAPIDRTRSTFVVLATPVTSAPSAWAICTAKVPTPPDAPMISTCWPARARPVRSACSAVSPDKGTAEAGHQADRVRLAGHEVPGAPVEPGRVDAEQHLVVLDGRLVHLLEAKHVGGAVLAVNDRQHRPPRRRCRGAGAVLGGGQGLTGSAGGRGHRFVLRSGGARS